MRFIRILVILVILTFFGIYAWQQKNVSFEAVVKSEVVVKNNERQYKIAPDRTSKQNPFDEELYDWIGKKESELIKTFGEPERKDPSAYHYTWLVYTDYADQYIQFGIENDVVKTIFMVEDDLGISLESGQDYDLLNDLFGFQEEVSYSERLTAYTFQLTNEDIKQRPLVKVNDNIFMQLYFDTFTNKLSSVRILDGDILLRHRPYAVTYRGNIPAEADFTQEEWRQIEKGMEQQVFLISNVLRNRFNLTILNWDQEVSEVAFNHSKDMNNNNYFSHFSQNGDGLKERLTHSGLFYVAAGENIAAQYTDAAAVVEGWLNSEGHREALLTEEYTHLGVGVYRFYYTQNFLAKPM